MRILLLFLSLSITTFIYSQSITNETIAAGFSSTLKNNVHLSSSIGEAGPVQYLLKSGGDLTQGYLQVENKGKVSILDAKKKEIISLYPNPAIDFIHIDLLEFANERIEISIFNSLGQEVVKSSLTKMGTPIYILDVSSLASAEYTCFIQIKNEATKQFAIKFFKK